MKVNFENIYEHIGYLFFALASDHGKLRSDRQDRLTELIEKTWRPTANGDSALNMHLVDCIHAGIRFAIENGMSADHAMTSFADYYRIHSVPFGRALKDKILASCLQIVSEFPTENGSRFQGEIERLFKGELMLA